MDADGVFRHVVAEIVGLTVGQPLLYSTSCHPGRKASRVMIATVALRAEVALAINSPPEFATPDHEGVIEETAEL